MSRVLSGDIPCKDCGTDINPIWFTDSVFWNAVMGGDTRGYILCPYCFITRAEEKFDLVGWKLLPDWKWKEKDNNESKT